MASESGERVKTLFLQAIERPEEEWSAFLDANVGGEPELRARIEALLKEHSTSGLMDESPFSFAPDPSGMVLGRYRIDREIGRGGFATVYVADQLEPVQRRVALKLLSPGMDSRSIVARFEAEKQLLAALDHPHIATIFDAGATPSGRPYFVMELVDGKPITDHCDESRLTVIERLELFRRVCLAIDHSHTRGVIHRDIKPSNVLVTVTDDEATPKVIDFGIAKTLDAELEDTSLTRLDGIVGTPASMAPEQTLPGEVVDARTDVYALGALLYNLLTGAAPLELAAGNLPAIVRAIQETDPVPPSRRLSAVDTATKSSLSARQIARELDWIAMRCLEKEPARRYPSAAALADDVARFLRHEPVTARAPSIVYRVRKLARRRRGVIGVAGLLAFVTLITAMLVGQGRRAVERDREQLAGLVSDVVAQSDASDRNDARTKALLARWAARVVSGKSTSTDLELLVLAVTRHRLEGRSLIPLEENYKMRLLLRSREGLFLPGISLAYRIEARVDDRDPFGPPASFELYGKDGGGGTFFGTLSITPVEGPQVFVARTHVRFYEATADTAYLRKHDEGWPAGRRMLGECTVDLDPLHITALRGVEIVTQEVDDPEYAAKTDERIRISELVWLANPSRPMGDGPMFRVRFDFEELFVPLALELVLKDPSGEVHAEERLIVSRSGEVLGSLEHNSLPRADGRWIPMSCHFFLKPTAEELPVDEGEPWTLSLHSSKSVARGHPSLDAFLRFESTRELKLARRDRED